MHDRVPIEAMKGHGQSIAATIDKERCLGSALTIGMKIANTHFGDRGFTYWHFDANAGSGHNDLCDVPGSPIVFHRAADICLTGMARAAFFCDIDTAALKHLKSLLDGWMSTSCLLPADNQESLDLFAECIRRSGERTEKVIGSVIVDPNGYWYRNAKGEGPPTQALPRFAREFPRIDIILNLNVRTYQLQRAQGHQLMSPREVLARLHKKHWLVRRTTHGGDRWLLAVGRNVETGDHRKIGFHKLESEAGSDVMLRSEGTRQNELPI
jgi:hypothetical protein